MRWLIVGAVIAAALTLRFSPADPVEEVHEEVHP